MLFHREVSDNLNVLHSCGSHMAINQAKVSKAFLFDGGIFRGKSPRANAGPVAFFRSRIP